MALGTLLKGKPKPWEYFEVPAILVNAYEIIKKKKLLSEIRRKGGLHKFLEYDGIIFLDSGGFQAMIRNISINLNSLTKIYKVAKADYFFSLDYPCISNENLKKSMQKTILNYKKLREKVKNIIPVVHPPIERALKEYEAYIAHDPKYLAIGGLVPLMRTTKGISDGRKKVVEIIAEIRNRFRSSIHVMGLGAPTVIPLLKVLKCDSTDSASWRIKAAHGKIMLPNGGERHITNKSAKFGVVKLREEEKRMLDKLNCPVLKEYGWEKLESSFEVRALFNAWIMIYSNKNTQAVNGVFSKLLDYAAEQVIKG